MSNSSFERYAPYIQRFIYRKGWCQLHPVQTDACNALLDTTNHIIITSQTASGKTEAAFFPMLTILDKDPSATVGIMYISPLKALINDQCTRLNELLRDQNIPVWPWHGDISQSSKERVMRSPRGIVQITPESLESLILHHAIDIPALFGDLRFIVIDEIHSFIGTDRGLQIQCLITELERITHCKPRRIGLSATLKDHYMAKKYIQGNDHTPVTIIEPHPAGRKVALCVEQFTFEKDNDQWLNAIKEYNNYLYEHSYNKKCLIFAQNRNKVERTAASLKMISQQKGDPDIFCVHHSSVSASLRKNVESKMRNQNGPLVTVATSSLELGIDIGDLDTVIQLGPPNSCASFVQRLGRSGRKTGRSQMIFVTGNESVSIHSPYDMPWDLLQTISIIQLYKEEKWIEPFEDKKKPYSLLAHQTISFLIMNGAASASQATRHVLTLPPFEGKISLNEYKELLQNMISKDYLQLLEDKEIIVGLKGERIANAPHFCSVFRANVEYRVICNHKEIGKLDFLPKVSSTFVLAGVNWKAITIDEKHRKVFVAPASKAFSPIWRGGEIPIHEKIAKQIKDILKEDTVYSYLTPSARVALQQARDYARSTGLLTKSIVSFDEHIFYLFPWCGTKQMVTIEKILSCGAQRHLGIINDVERSTFFLKFISKFTAAEVAQQFQSLCLDICDPDILLGPEKLPLIDKYDYMLPKSLLKKSFLYNHSTTAEAYVFLKNIDG